MRLASGVHQRHGRLSKCIWQRQHAASCHVSPVQALLCLERAEPMSMLCTLLCTLGVVPRSAKLLSAEWNLRAPIVRTLELHTPVVIDGVTVTALDANHW